MTGKRRVVLKVEDLEKRFPSNSWLGAHTGEIVAVDGVSFELEAGRTLGIVGESGSGKSTVIRTLLRLEEPTAGGVWVDGQDFLSLSPPDLRRARRDIQIVFQNPYASLDRRMTVAQIVSEPWRVHPGAVDKAKRPARLRQLLEQVGLHAEDGSRYPSELSGGQRQRVAIARALALEPKVLICDEPLSALDVSIQAQIIHLLEQLQDELGMAYVIVSHDLSVVRQICDDVAVMYLGRFVEFGPAAQVCGDPAHPYTQALLSAVPRVGDSTDGVGRIVLDGELPDPSAPPSGCHFRTRCWKAEQICAEETPPPRVAGAGQYATCHFDREAIRAALPLLEDQPRR